MARIKDERKRRIILDAAKTLFAARGYAQTSVADIVKETGLPIGSIYTYFKGKEEIISTIVEEGWEQLQKEMRALVEEKLDPREKLRLLIDKFLPEILKDMDFVNIILSEALVYTRIEAKLESLTDVMMKFVGDLSKTSPLPLDRHMVETALVVYFLGILNAARLARTASVGIKVADIIAFTKASIEGSLGVKL
jgi:AcrR family transcriptional regulator